MTLHRLSLVALVSICVPALAASSCGAAPAGMLAPPIVFYVAKGAPDACGSGCDSWIAAEGQVDTGAALRFRKFQRQVKDRNLPMYFLSPGGNLDQALVIGAALRETPVVARVGRTVVKECGFEAQDSDVCLKLKQSGRELHADLSTRGAACNSACPYLMLGATTREIAPDAQLGVHSPKIILHFSGGEPTQQIRTAAAERGLERVDRMLAAYFVKMGGNGGLLDLAKTVKFENMHVLTREEIVRFGIDRREFVETPWTFENNARSMIRKFAVQKNDTENAYRMTQWRLICFNVDQFELDFQRPATVSTSFATISISNGSPKPLRFAFPPAKPPGFEIWGLRMNGASVQSLAGLHTFDFTETTLAPDGRWLAHAGKFSNEGLTGALADLLATCPPQKGSATLQTGKPRDSAAK